MIETLMVSVSGPAFSLLLFENVNNCHDQEGFLLGKIIEKEKQTITDNDQRVVNVERNIKVNSVIPCPHTCYFYNSAGKVNEHKLKSFLGDEYKNVIAWYKHKYLSSFKFTLREKIVHKQLLQIFNNVPSDLFTFCLLRTEQNDNATTHLYSQTFIRYASCSYQPLPMHIINLSDPNNCYKRSEPTSDTFNNIIKKLKVDSKKTQGLVLISAIQTSLNNSIDQLVSKKLSEAEKKLYELEKEIEERMKLKNNLPSTSKNVSEMSHSNEKLLNDNTVQSSTSQIQVKNHLVENGSKDVNSDELLVSDDNSTETSRISTRAQAKTTRQTVANRKKSLSKSPSKNNSPQIEEETIKTRSSARNQTRSTYSQVAQRSKN